MPRLNQLTRCALEPCVNDSGTTVPCDFLCSVSSPIWAAALSAASMSPGLEAPAVFLLRARRPDAGEAVGLQLDAHAERVRLRLAAAPAQRVDLVHDAELVLHVVADLVGDDVGLGELARRAEALLEHLVEAQVDVDLAGRSGSRTAPSPPGPGRTPSASCPRRGRAWAAGRCGPTARKTSVQTDLGAAQHLRDELRARIVRRRRRRGALLLDDLAAAVAAAHHAEQRQRVDAEDPAGDDRHRDAAEADAAAADAEAAAAAAAHAADVLDVAALFLAVHAHVVSPGVNVAGC